MPLWFQHGKVLWAEHGLAQRISCTPLYPLIRHTFQAQSLSFLYGACYCLFLVYVFVLDFFSNSFPPPALPPCPIPWIAPHPQLHAVSFNEIKCLLSFTVTCYASLPADTGLSVTQQFPSSSFYMGRPVHSGWTSSHQRDLQDAWQSRLTPLC